METHDAIRIAALRGNHTGRPDVHAAGRLEIRRDNLVDARGAVQLPRASGDAFDAELVVYYFGGSGGTIDANIERWVGQMQQPDGRPSSAVMKRQSRTINGMKVTLVDVPGTYVAEITPGSPQRHNSPNFHLRAAVIETTNGPYFIKLTGPAKTVAAAEKTFEAFLGSVKFTP